MAANLYTKDHPNHNYFSDLIMIHMSLGLGVKYGKAVALASLVSSLLSFVPDRESVGLYLNIFIYELVFSLLNLKFKRVNKDYSYHNFIW